MKIGDEIKEGIRIAIEAIRGNLMRSTLTTIGIVIGVVTVTLMATAIEGLNNAFRDTVSFMGTDVLYVSKREWFIDSEEKWREQGKRRRITLAEARALERSLGMTRGISPTVDTVIQSIRYKNRASSLVRVVGTNEQYLVTGGIAVASGRFMTKAEAYANRDVCVLGSEVAESLFVNESPLGQRIHIGGQALEVIGVLEKRGRGFGLSMVSLDSQVVIPIGKMVANYRWNPNCTILVKAGDPGRVAEAREELRGLMRKIRRVPPGKDDDFSINQQEQLLNQFRRVSAVIATTGFFITGLSLFVGGIGIMNIMFVSVTERTAEIGIRKALGARRRTILLQFLIEAIGICLLGGVLALVISRGLVEVARLYLPGISMPPSVVILALGVASVTGVVSGFLPAWHAARMTPVNALRNE
jgi:putative ABC transport system permease protein